MQIQLCVIYLAAVWAKVRGVTWNDGTAVAYALRIDDLARFPLPHFVAESPLIVGLATYATLAVELSLPILVWNRKARPFVLLAGLGMHMSIDYRIMVGFFSYAMIVMYLSFLPPERASAVVLWLRQRVLSSRFAGIRPRVRTRVALRGLGSRALFRSPPRVPSGRSRRSQSLVRVPGWACGGRYVEGALPSVGNHDLQRRGPTNDSST
jgi:hypothetical protein